MLHCICHVETKNRFSCSFPLFHGSGRGAEPGAGEVGASMCPGLDGGQEVVASIRLSTGAD